jgi:hypothetical protein
MLVLRLAGWALLLVGLMVLVRDVLLWIDLARWVPLTLADAWQLLANFAPLRSGGVSGPIAELWICPALLILGAVLLRLGRRRLRYRPF